MVSAGPRERLAEVGREGLADCELLALVLGTGTRGESAVGLGQRVLERFGGLAGLGGVSPAQLAALHGLGEARSARVVASLELGVRLTRAAPRPRPRITCPADVHQIVGTSLSLLQYETFRVLLLGGRNDLLGVRTVGRGTRDACLVHARDIFAEALAVRASSIILVHNHPSGDPAPSDEDWVLTRNAAEGGRVLGIPVRDHVIVASMGYCSLKEAGWVT